MSDKPQASAQPLTLFGEAQRLMREMRSHLFYAATVSDGCNHPSPGWCESASKSCNEGAAFIDRLLATIDALTAELAELREGRRKLLDELDAMAAMATMGLPPEWHNIERWLRGILQQKNATELQPAAAQAAFGEGQSK